MLIKKSVIRWWGAVLCLWFSFGTVQASPWAAVGDMQLRNDVELLARYGIISGPVNSWPISWKQIVCNLSHASEMDIPTYVQLAVMRMKERIPAEFRGSLRVQVTNNAAVVRGFQKTARNDTDVEAIAEYNNKGSGMTVHIQGGYRKGDAEDYAHLDGSYISQDFNNWSAYAGAFDRWWGPGRESTLMLSNNARPMPSVGLRRIEPKAFKAKWLRWMGPWQLDVFLARMEKNREISHALIAGVRLTFEPFKNFEVGLSRVIQLCGENRPCNLETWARSIIAGGNLDNGAGSDTEPSNQLASIDLSYSAHLGKRVQMKVYGEGTGEDETTFLPYKYAGLVGVTLYGPYGVRGAQWRFTSEYSNTTTKQAWFFGGRKQTNIMFNHHIYKTGYRYKGRVLGHSLDSDSRLLTLAAAFHSASDWEYIVKYHNAHVNDDGTGINALSIPNKNMDIFEASVQGEVGYGSLIVNVRHSSDGIPALGNEGAFTSFGFVWKVNY